jgi:hypothetical protein
MDSPSLESPQPIALSHSEREAGDDSQLVYTTDRSIRPGSVLIAGFGNTVAADFAAFANQRSQGGAIVVADAKVRQLVDAPIRSLAIDELFLSTRHANTEHRPVDSLILFISPHLTADERRQIDDLIAIAHRCQARFLGIISTFRVHLDDPGVVEVENDVVSRAAKLFDRVAVFRPGHVLSGHSPLAGVLDRLAPFYPLIPRSLTCCFVEGTELFLAVEAERLKENRRARAREPWQGAETTTIPLAPGRPVSVKNRAYTILGENRPWRDILVRHRATGPGPFLKTAVSTLLSWLMIGHAIAFVFTLLARVWPWMRQWNVQTLRPRSLGELLALCHRHNISHVRVVGYNNGVAHFGHRHPGKTIVSTVRCRRMAFAGPHTLKTDAGATVRNALDCLARSHQELYVVPNYSYVCLGTSFFVPIHGSAVDYSTVADTICKVVLYDPDTDRIMSAARTETAFREHVYNQQSRAVLLRLYIRAKAKSRYFVHRETLENPSAPELLAALHDPRATNVEIRQSHAASTRVTVARYYTELDENSSPALELPRDALGRLWDRLEENPVTSYLMHALSRRVAWHTELFFTPEQFDLFWRTHGQLPLRKIQLRYLRRDGLPHSPCRDNDCVSADLFMFRMSRHRFFDYLENAFTTVKTNPGKHGH